MAGDSGENSQGVSEKCIRCRKIAPGALNCIKCGSTVHKGCVKLLKTGRLLNDVDIICCEGIPSADNLKTCDLKVDSIDEGSECGSVGAFMVEIKYLKKLVEQKDLVISTQKDAIGALKDQVRLLKSGKTGTSNATKAADLGRETNLSCKPVVNALSSGNVNNRNNFNHNVLETGRNNKPVVSAEEVALGLHRAKTTAVLDAYIHLDGDANSPNPIKEAGKSRSGYRTKPIVGVKKVISEDGAKAGVLRAAIEYSPLHVYKLHVNTTVEELVGYLKPDFPEVKVEKLNSAHPELYSSFKVTVLKENELKALNPELWPTGVRLSRFFVYRKREELKK